MVLMFMQWRDNIRKAYITNVTQMCAFAICHFFQFTYVFHSIVVLCVVWG